MFISLDAENAFDKIHYTVMLKILERSGNKRTYLNIIKAIYSHDQLNKKNFELIPPKSGTRQGCPLYPYSFNIVLKVLTRTIR